MSPGCVLEVFTKVLYHCCVLQYLYILCTAYYLLLFNLVQYTNSIQYGVSDTACVNAKSSLDLEANALLFLIYESEGNNHLSTLKSGP